MRKKIFGLVAVSALVTMALCACQVAIPQNHKDLLSNGQTENTQDLPEEKSGSAATDHTSDAPDGDKVTFPDWQTAYLDFIERRERDYGRESDYGFEFCYALVYIDHDDIPELYVMGHCEADGDLIFSYKNGRIMEQRLARTCGGKYVERSGMMINQNGHMGYYYDNVYQLDQNGFSQILDASRSERYVPLENRDFEIVVEYFIDDKSVSRDEYRDAVNHAIDLSKTVDLCENAVSYDEIKQQIAGLFGK